MKTIALIPARSGSKRVPGKNTRLLGGAPLLAWSILVAKGSDLIHKVVVSSDSEETLKTAERYGALGFLRGETASSDNATDYEVAIDFLGLKPLGDLIVYLRPTTPFRTPAKINEAIKIMQEGEYDSLRSVEEMSESAYKCFRVKFGLCKPLTKKDFTDFPNQRLPKTYKPNGYVDVVRPEIVMSGSLWGRGRYAFITDRAVEIDTMEDFEFAEYTAQKNRRL